MLQKDAFPIEPNASFAHVTIPSDVDFFRSQKKVAACLTRLAAFDTEEKRRDTMDFWHHVVTYPRQSPHQKQLMEVLRHVAFGERFVAPRKKRLDPLDIIYGIPSVFGEKPLSYPAHVIIDDRIFLISLFYEQKPVLTLMPYEGEQKGILMDERVRIPVTSPRGIYHRIFAACISDAYPGWEG